MMPIVLTHWATYLYLIWVVMIFVVLLVQMRARLPRGSVLLRPPGLPAAWDVATGWRQCEGKRLTMQG